MRSILPLLLIAAPVFAAPILAAPSGWHANLKDGLEAAKKSGKPLFVATCWKKGV